MLGVSELASR